MTKICECRTFVATFTAALLTIVLGCGRTQSSETRTGNLSAMAVLQWKLPDTLHEISGLAALPDGRLFAHDDEHGVIYEIDPAEGELKKSFALGDPPLRGDFEGIAIADRDFYLMTSDGIL